jgi:hypothetical protein
MASREVVLTITPKRPTGLHGLSPERIIAVMRARAIARYWLHTPAGRPEELESNTFPAFGQPKRISFGYIHGSVRIRQHGGASNREWVDHVDLRTDQDGWINDMHAYLDPYFHFQSPDETNIPRNIPV